jgi:hypothetical protein
MIMNPLSILYDKTSSDDFKPVNFFNKKIIQHELYTAKVNTVCWTHRMEKQQAVLIIFTQKVYRSFQIVKIDSDKFTVQIDEQVQDAVFSLTDMTKIMCEHYSRVNQKLSLEDFASNTQEYLREIEQTERILNIPTINMPNCYELNRLDNKSNNLVDMLAEVKEVETNNPKAFDWIKRAPKSSTKATTFNVKNEVEADSAYNN